jgi:hypothetical protein
VKAVAVAGDVVPYRAAAGRFWSLCACSGHIGVDCCHGEDGDYSDDGDYGVRRLFLTATLAEEDRTGKAKSFAHDY